MTQAKAIDEMNFEDALKELEGIVTALETGQAPLEDSITAYERGIALKKHCEAKLHDAKMKIEKITVAKDGTPSTTPLDPQE